MTDCGSKFILQLLSKCCSTLHDLSRSMHKIHQPVAKMLSDHESATMSCLCAACRWKRIHPPTSQYCSRCTISMIAQWNVASSVMSQMKVSFLGDFVCRMCMHVHCVCVCVCVWERVGGGRGGLQSTHKPDEEVCIHVYMCDCVCVCVCVCLHINQTVCLRNLCHLI